jgi:hypothetical protein
MSPLLTTTSTVMCPHAGTVQLFTSNTLALVENAPVLLLTDRHTITGCAFAPGGVPSPCLTVQWLTGTVQMTINQIPALLKSSVGLCLNALQVPQGTALVMQTQTQAMGV